MVCKPRYKKLISLLIDDELPKKKDLIAHLKTCEKCKRYYELCLEIDKQARCAVFCGDLKANLKRLNLESDIFELVLDRSTIKRSSLPAVAGSNDKIPFIKGEVLAKCGLPKDAAIIFTLKEDKYAIRIESDNPVRLTLVFFQNEIELYKVRICEQIPTKLVPVKAIKGWTDIKIFKE